MKTEDEKFPGAVDTYTFEAMMQDGKALQAGTSHYLGQTFSKSCEIKFQGRDGNEHFAYTTSWGISTRLIGAMIMTHADDDGMIMPPRVAPYHVGIIPIVRDDQDIAAIDAYADQLSKKLKDKGVRVFIDKSDKRTPDKMWGMVKQGVPVRVEIGAREMQDGTLTHVRRDLGRDSKTTCSVDEFVSGVNGILDSIHEELLGRARKIRDANIHDLDNLAALEKFFKDGKTGFARMDISVINDPDYERIKKENGLSSRCMAFADEGKKVLVAKAY